MKNINYFYLQILFFCCFASISYSSDKFSSQTLINLKNFRETAIKRAQEATQISDLKPIGIWISQVGAFLMGNNAIDESSMFLVLDFPKQHHFPSQFLIGSGINTRGEWLLRLTQLEIDPETKKLSMKPIFYDNSILSAIKKNPNTGDHAFNELQDPEWHSLFNEIKTSFPSAMPDDSLWNWGAGVVSTRNIHDWMQIFLKMQKHPLVEKVGLSPMRYPDPVDARGSQFIGTGDKSETIDFKQLLTLRDFYEKKGLQFRNSIELPKDLLQIDSCPLVLERKK